MREILFRGKDIETKKWVYGSYFEHKKVNLFYFDTELGNQELQQKIDNNMQYLIVQDKIADFNMNNGIQIVDVDPNTIGQYTGLVDKNGTKIFEGDLVKHEWSDTPYTVQFKEDRCGYSPFANDGGCGCCCDVDCTSVEDIEVIGNIYDKEGLNDK